MSITKADRPMLERIFRMGCAHGELFADASVSTDFQRMFDSLALPESDPLSPGVEVILRDKAALILLQAWAVEHSVSQMALKQLWRQAQEFVDTRPSE